MSLFIFSNKNFKNEVLSFNWSFNLIEYRLFKHSSQYFFMKGFKPGSAVSVVFKRFLNSGLNIAFILRPLPLDNHDLMNSRASLRAFKINSGDTLPLC